MLSKKEIDGARNRFSGDSSGAASVITLMNYCHANAAQRCHFFYRGGGGLPLPLPHSDPSHTEKLAHHAAFHVNSHKRSALALESQIKKHIRPSRFQK